MPRYAQSLYRSTIRGDIVFFEAFDEYIRSFNVVRLISQAHFGGGQFSEIYETITQINEHDPDSWHDEWRATASRLEEVARNDAAAGHTVSARSKYQRACEYWRMADLFVRPDDPRRLAAYRRSVKCFSEAGKFFDPPLEQIEIPFEDGSLPGYFFPGIGQQPGERRPTVIFFGGADSTSEELYFTAPGIMQRGFACMVVDGPGQGATLRLRGMPTRFDYEVPVSAAVEYALTRSDTDPNRLALCSMSLGGYYACRAAAFEHRFKAVIVWGACYDYAEVWRRRPDDHPLAPHMVALFGARNIRHARKVMERFTLAGILGEITAPTLVVHGEDDRSVPVEHAHRTYSELECEKSLKIFPSGRSGSAHCQQDNLALANDAIFDWLADTIGV